MNANGFLKSGVRMKAIRQAGREENPAEQCLPPEE
jgi:hypothetical protein